MRIHGLGVVLGTLLALAGAPAAPAPPRLPPDVAPLSPEQRRHIEELTRAAVEYRGLPIRRPVPAGTLDEAGLKRKLVEILHEELPPRDLAAFAAALKAFGLIPQDLDLGRFIPALLTEQVAGFYDTRRKYLALVRHAAPGPKTSHLLGTNLGEKGGQVDDLVLVHELVHALQDQSFELPSHARPLSDADAARQALIEGDATLVMFDSMLQSRVEAVPGFRAHLEQVLGNPALLAGGGAGPAGGKQMAAAPAWFRDTMLFSYMQGLLFCASARQTGGQKLLDHAFAQDPPRSTEQILHPEKWHGRRDDPIVLLWPDLGRELPGYQKTAEGTLGEEGIRILLRGRLADDGKAATAAAGWGGDRFAVYQKGGKRLLAWITEWDTEADAREFQAAAAALGDDWQVEPRAPRRVQLVRGDLAAAERAAVGAKLAAVAARPPENRAIDLAAIGAKPETAPEPKP
jgi:hypothetical protein